MHAFAFESVHHSLLVFCCQLVAVFYNKCSDPSKTPLQLGQKSHRRVAKKSSTSSADADKSQRTTFQSFSKSLSSAFNKCTSCTKRMRLHPLCEAMCLIAHDDIPQVLLSQRHYFIRILCKKILHTNECLRVTRAGCFTVFCALFIQLCFLRKNNINFLCCKIFGVTIQKHSCKCRHRKLSHVPASQGKLQILGS